MRINIEVRLMLSEILIQGFYYHFKFLTLSIIYSAHFLYR
jgi:hypothetical protein